MTGRGAVASMGKAGSLTMVAVAYAMACGVAWSIAEAVGPDRPVWALAGGYVASALVIYLWSMGVDNGSMFDAWWSVLPPLAAVWMAVTATADVPGLRVALVLVVVWAWAIRLTLNWARDWVGLSHEDWRYLDLYSKGPKALVSLVAVHLGPCLIVLLGSLPLVPALHEGTNEVAVLDWLALMVGAMAVLMELVADEQMRSFGRTKEPGQIMDRGLWRYSRHPNYFGEVLFWWSLWLFGLSADPSWWWTIIGPIAILVMFLTASIPLLDDRSRERRPGFAEYAARTSALVPMPPRKG
jgi:steroid 5-alpha reductase family enzyme